MAKEAGVDQRFVLELANRVKVADISAASALQQYGLENYLKMYGQYLSPQNITNLAKTSTGRFIETDAEREFYQETYLPQIFAELAQLMDHMGFGTGAATIKALGAGGVQPSSGIIGIDSLSTILPTFND